MIDSKTKLFLFCGAIAGPLFLVVVLIEGAARPNYNALLYPLSSLSIGNSGWTQISNFILTGTLLLFFSSALRKMFNSAEIKSKSPLLIRLVGIGLIGAGIFVTDPVYGYPIDKPLVLNQFTINGHLHDAFSMLVFICLPWACFAFRKCFMIMHQIKWGKYSAFSGYAMIAAFIVTSLGFKHLPGFVNYAGLFQRLCLAVGFIWITMVSIHLLKSETNYK